MRTIEVGKNQTVIDIALQEFGNRLAVFDIIEDNPNIYNINGDVFSLTSELVPGQKLDIRTTGDVYQEKSFSQTTESAIKRVKAEKNQTIMDIATQEYGNQLAVFKVIEDNPNIANTESGVFSITKDLALGQEIIIQKTGELRKQKTIRNIPNKVTSYITETVGGKKDRYLANENLTYITTEDGTKIFMPQ